MQQRKTELRNGMRIEWDVPIAMADGIVLRADVFRPGDDGRHPVVMTHGPYAKGLAFQDGYPGMWGALTTEHPDAVLANSSNQLPKLGDRRPGEMGARRLRLCPGGLTRGRTLTGLPRHPQPPARLSDYSECIEWAGTQPWSNGKVGLLGISYYAMNQWQVAALQPPHLAAICPWEGATILPGIQPPRRHPQHLRAAGIPIQVSTVQHGVGDRGRTQPE